jgi:hypothetical protein
MAHKFEWCSDPMPWLEAICLSTAAICGKIQQQQQQQQQQFISSLFFFSMPDLPNFKEFHITARLSGLQTL